ncbi:hypothetical protein BpHYR1_038192 [Brachionus plicatilis]|uniref:Uncharacterized protein n=1 Tax=Brachionus plicatilis TaxID=10195 RepID=A0A3M7TA38_BRAPC|nr:hypothetical protein BpHYR1_038192 [Brachionus plicatilis]
MIFCYTVSLFYFVVRLPENQKIIFTDSLQIIRQILDSNKSYTRSFALNSDAGETTSTDSDIGTSPSGITLASPPSSPQQPQQSPAKNYYTNFDQSNRSNYSPNINTPSLNYSSIIRQHSYLNAVQLNDFKINKLMQSNCLQLIYNPITKEALRNSNDSCNFGEEKANIMKLRKCVVAKIDSY